MAVRASPDWDRLIPAALAGDGVAVAFQPIVDLQAGRVAGYEALARFSGPPGLTPDRWFMAARERGLSRQLDAAIIRAALAMRPQLPPDCFLTVNIEPDSLGHPEVDESLVSSGRLDGVVLEVTEHVPVHSYDEMERALVRYRALGALVGLDDAGSGYAGLQQVLRLRPAMLKVDRALIDGIDRDGAKLALVEMLGVFADRIDAWVLAEGVERPEEAAALQGLGVPLAQGFFFGRPGPGWGSLSGEAAAFFARRPPDPVPQSSLRFLARASVTIAEDRIGEAMSLLAEGDLEWIVVVDRDDRPVGLVDRDAALARVVHRPLMVNLTSTVVEVAHRMLTRPATERFWPVVCRDDSGRYCGTVRAELVMSALISLASAAQG